MLPTEETVVTLDVNCKELGHFPYELRLKALPAHPEKVTRVNATLGAVYAFPLPVTNHTSHNAEFTIEVRKTRKFYNKCDPPTTIVDNRSQEILLCQFRRFQ